MYKETYIFPDGGKAHVWGDERIIQAHYVGPDKQFIEKFTEVFKQVLKCLK